ncbi:MAG: DUF2334 domain-containing protein [Nanoarchaeota archaeon]|nr:DUF2334 domain-containing protein [Nanoarchaeota archaeon]
MKRGLKIFFIILISLIVLLFLIRLISPREIDDVNPFRNCEREYLEKADVFWVIPYYKEIRISDNESWCKEIALMNKTIGMHGYTHEYHEFEDNLSVVDIEKGMEIIYDCFNSYPEMFKAPYLALSKENKILLEEKNLIVKGIFNQWIHKVYHCSDSGRFSNKFHDIF